MSVDKVQLVKLAGTLFIENERSLLLLEHQQSLVLLSPLATLLLITNESEHTRAECIDYLAEQLSLSADVLNQEYQQLSSLIDGIETSASFQDSQYPELSKSPDLTLNENAHRCYLAIENGRFAISCQDTELFNALILIFTPIRVDKCQPDFVLDITVTDGCYDIRANGLEVNTGLAFDEVVPELIDRLQILTYQKEPYFACFHGGAIQLAETVYLLPGESGKGKSTLCAALQSSHSQTFSDEFIVVNKDFSLLNIPLPLAIKSGSWAHLSAKYPELAHAPQWRRLDGRTIKYIWPDNLHCSELAVQPSRVQIVFPHFISSNDIANKLVGEQSRNGAVVTHLSVIETLYKLTQGGYQLRDTLTESSIEQLIAFLENANRMSLSYSSTKEALAAMELSYEQ